MRLAAPADFARLSATARRRWWPGPSPISVLPKAAAPIASSSVPTRPGPFHAPAKPRGPTEESTMTAPRPETPTPSRVVVDVTIAAPNDGSGRRCAIPRCSPSGSAGTTTSWPRRLRPTSSREPSRPSRAAAWISAATSSSWRPSARGHARPPRARRCTRPATPGTASTTTSTRAGGRSSRSSPSGSRRRAASPARRHSRRTIYLAGHRETEHRAEPVGRGRPVLGLEMHRAVGAALHAGRRDRRDAGRPGPIGRRGPVPLRAPARRVGGRLGAGPPGLRTASGEPAVTAWRRLRADQHLRLERRGADA